MSIVKGNASVVEPQRRGVDPGAVLRAFLAAAFVSLLLYLFFVPTAVGAGNAAVVLRYMASVLLGSSVLPPPADLGASIVLAALAVHVVVSALMVLIITYVLHRWGLLTGFIGGAAFGLLFFLIIHYSLTYFYPHFYAMNHWSIALVHAVFGFVAGGVYELFECEPGEYLHRGGSR